MKKYGFKVIAFICSVIFTVIISYYLTQLCSYDEIWNYGFGSNIVDGLVPYKDFNMVITPFFPYLLAVIFSIFGKKLIVYHIVIAVIVVGITFLAFRKIKFYSLLIYVALLIYSTNGYNTSTLLWLFILLTILDRKNDKYNDILIPIIISIMALTKQTLVLLAIPSLIYSKNKKKTLAVYLIFFFGFLGYLISQNNLIQFLDYCLFGMFDFADNNKHSVLLYLVLEIIILFCLLITLIKSKGRRQDVFYVLLYQVITMPILEIFHFVLGWSAFVYIIFKSEWLNEVVKNTLFIVLIIVEFYLLFVTNFLYTIAGSKYFSYYSGQAFLEGRLSPAVTEGYIEKMSNYIEKYSDYELYILGGYSYLVKLVLDIPINKFDLINNGNMGYDGARRYIEEIKDNCSNNKCIFIVNDNDLKEELYNQTNKDILKFVTLNNTKIYASTIFGVYVNEEGLGNEK